MAKADLTLATGELAQERWYLLTRLPPGRCGGPADRLGLFRGHWSIENSRHHVKDRSWDEDRHNPALSVPTRLSPAFVANRPDFAIVLVPDVPRHSLAILSLSEVVTIGILHAMKNVSQRAFYDWLKDDYGHLFPRLPDRTRLFRRIRAKGDWTGYFLANFTVLGVADSYGVELRHPIREGRRDHQIGKKGKSNHRWIVGGKLCIVLNKLGLITDWDCATANRHDQTFLPLLDCYDGQVIILTDTGFHQAKGDPDHVMLCRRGEWNVRMIVETTFSMMTQVWGSKEMRHRTWEGFEAHLAYLMAAFNILVQWDGLEPDENGRIHRSIARFTL